MTHAETPAFESLGKALSSRSEMIKGAKFSFDSVHTILLGICCVLFLLPFFLMASSAFRERDESFSNMETAARGKQAAKTSACTA